MAFKRQIWAINQQLRILSKQLRVPSNSTPENAAVRYVSLITPEELVTLPSGTALIDILGSTAVVGKDPIDGDTRAGFLAYGFPLRRGMDGMPTPSESA